MHFLFSTGKMTSSYPLDGISMDSSDLVFSLRKLTARATNAIIVRRSSDNAEQVIGFSGRDLDTTALLAFVGAGNGFVAAWYDQSPNGNNAVQTVAVTQPQIVSSGALIVSPKGRPAMRFTAANSTVLTTGSSVVTDASVQFFLHAETIAAPASGNGNFFRNTGGGAVLYLNSLSSNRYTFNNGVVIGSLISGDGHPGGIIECFSGPNAGQGRLILNGSIIGSGNTGVTSVTGTMNIGKGTGTQYITMTCAEAIFIKGLTESARISLERNMASYYGVTLA